MFLELFLRRPWWDSEEESGSGDNYKNDREGGSEAKGIGLEKWHSGSRTDKWLC